MGFYLEYWSTLLKGPLATRFKISREVGRIEKFSNRAMDLLFHKFPDLIEKEHKVTYFLTVFVKFVTAIKKTGHNCFEVLYNESTQDMTEIKEIEGILKELGEFWQKMPAKQQFKKIELEFLLHVAQALKEDEGQEREEYKEIEAIINEALEAKKDHERFMNALRVRFKQKEKLHNIFERIAWRKSVRTAKYDLAKTHQVKKELFKLLKKITGERSSSKLDSYARELETLLNEAKDGIAQMIKESYLVKERAILMVLRVLYIVETADKTIKKAVDKRLLPRQASEEKLLTLNEAVNEIGKDFRTTIAQEFRIVIHDVEKLEKELRALKQEVEN